MLAIGIGTNIGNRKRNIEKALELICLKIGKVTSVSSIYEAEPWGFKSNQWFYNAVCLVESTQSVYDIMIHLLFIEQSIGRIRKKTDGYKNRVIDLDILLLNDEIINTDTLKIPHPHIHERLFVLIPLQELCPLWVHPILKKDVNQLLAECHDTTLVKKLVNV